MPISWSRRLSAVLLLALVLSTLWSGPAAAQPASDFVPGEILVKFRPGTSGQAVADAHRQNGGQDLEVIPGIDVRVVKVPAGLEHARVAAYQRNPNVEFAEVNGLYYADWTPNDSRFGAQWQYNNTDLGSDNQPVDADIDAPQAWGRTLGNGVIVAVLDTGIDQSHEDLQGKILANANFSSSRSWDDKYGHGTHVAGSIAASTNNGLGVAGTCPGCKLLNVKVLSDSGSGSWSGIANGIIWAATSPNNPNKAKVINMSLGGSGGSTTVEKAINDAWNAGVVVVASAGNSNTSSYSYPAAYQNVIAVAATDRADKKASFSNYGSWVDVSAPGVDILSTAPDHRNSIWRSGVKYGTISGTSMAAPHVAGVAGLVWSTGNHTNSTVRNQIESTTDNLANSPSKSGRVNAARAVGAAPD